MTSRTGPKGRVGDISLLVWTSYEWTCLRRTALDCNKVSESLICIHLGSSSQPARLRLSRGFFLQVVCVDWLFSQFSLVEAKELIQLWYAIIIIAGVLFRHRMAKACDTKIKRTDSERWLLGLAPRVASAIYLYLYEHRMSGPVLDVQRWTVTK